MNSDDSFSNTFRAYLLTDTGITAPVITSIGHTPSSHKVPGHGKFSPDSRKFAVCDGVGGTVQLFDFNNTTGVFSNPITLYKTSDGGQAYGLSFSPDNTKLYAGVGPLADSVYQWDVSSSITTTIVESKTFIHHFDVFSGHIYPQFQLGQDLKIYISGAIASYLAVINDPNAAGLTCNLVDWAIKGKCCITKN